MSGMGDMTGGMMSSMLMGALICVSLLVVAVIGIVGLVRGRQPLPVLSGDSTPLVSPQADPAVQELRRRLATGEIDEDEYLRRRSALE